MMTSKKSITVGSAVIPDINKWRGGALLVLFYNINSVRIVRRGSMRGTCRAKWATDGLSVVEYVRRISMPLSNCDSCGQEIRKNKSGLCKLCYQKSPLHSKQYAAMSTTSKETIQKKKSFSDWRILRDKKRLIVDLETNIDQHQAFVYKILSQRIQEVKEDFQRKCYSYWKLNEISQFLDDFSKKHSPQSDVKAQKSKP